MSQQSVSKAYQDLLLDLGSTFETAENGVKFIFEPTRTVKEGYKQMVLSGGHYPVVLPNREALKEHVPNKEGVYPFVVFHPAYEDRSADESPMLKKVLSLVRYNFNYKLIGLLASLVDILGNPKLQEDLSSEAMKFLKPINSAINAKTAEFVIKVLSNYKASKVNRLLLAPTKSTRSTHNNQKVEALYVLTSPLFKELVAARDGATKKVWGVPVTAKQHVEGFIKLINLVLPEIEGQVYDSSSVSRIAPKFDALTKMFADVVGKMDSVIGLLPEDIQKEILSTDNLRIAKLGWVSELENLSAVKNAYPALPGNTTAVEDIGATIAIENEQQQKVKEIKVEEDNVSSVDELLHAAGYNTRAKVSESTLKPIGVAASPKTVTIDGKTYILATEVGASVGQPNGLVLGAPQQSNGLSLGGNQQAGGIQLGGVQQNNGLMLGQQPQTHTFIDGSGNIRTVQQAQIVR